jgi:hypothetical protein
MKYNEQKLLINSFKYDLNDTQKIFKLFKNQIVKIIMPAINDQFHK